jgi:hypothetical protein
LHINDLDTESYAGKGVGDFWKTKYQGKMAKLGVPIAMSLGDGTGIPLAHPMVIGMFFNEKSPYLPLVTLGTEKYDLILEMPMGNTVDA